MPHRSSRPGRQLRRLDARLAAGGGPRTLATVLVALLTLEATVVLDRTLGDHDGGRAPSAPVAAAPDPSTRPASPAPVTSLAPTPPAVDTPAPVRASAGAPSASAPASPPSETAPPSAPAEPRAGTTAEPTPSSSSPPPPSRPAAGPEASGDDGDRRPPPPADPARRRFEQRFPAHADARQDPRAPATTRWAVLVGINDHQGRTRDNVTSRQDAEDLAAHLRSLGWRDDHVLLLTDATATRENVVQALAWLGRKTTTDSVAVFHYSGHTKRWPGRDVDGDGETTDEGLWPSDNRHVSDGELVSLLSRVSASRLWVDVGACHAAGFDDPGLAGPGRVLTFSSREDEKSYEDPEHGNSVWGHQLVEQGLRAGHGDADGDGVVTVEEAFAFAAPRAAARTERQGPGPQHPVMVDGLEGGFDLRIPAPPPSPRPSPSDDGCGLLGCTAARRTVVGRG